MNRLQVGCKGVSSAIVYTRNRSHTNTAHVQAITSGLHSCGSIVKHCYKDVIIQVHDSNTGYSTTHLSFPIPNPSFSEVTTPFEAWHSAPEQTGETERVGLFENICLIT